ncbi:MAG: hypothetical protein HC906_16035, partial [Bacteroidales bacterium]|nr:hypothetical protein [Bacteroidales bacterium]
MESSRPRNILSDLISRATGRRKSASGTDFRACTMQHCSAGCDGWSQPW